MHFAIKFAHLLVSLPGGHHPVASIMLAGDALLAGLVGDDAPDMLPDSDADHDTPHSDAGSPRRDGREAPAAARQAQTVDPADGAEPARAEDPGATLHHMVVARPKAAPAVVKWTRRTPELMKHARTVRDQLRVTRKLEETTAKVSEIEKQLGKVKATFPGVAHACGVLAKKRRRLFSDKLSMEEAQVLATLTFDFGCRTGFGVKPARLWAFGAKVLDEMQSNGIIRMLYLCSRFRAGHPSHRVSVCISHEFDTTKQQLALSTTQKFGKPGSRRVATEVLFQKAKIWVTLVTENEECTFSED